MISRSTNIASALAARAHSRRRQRGFLTNPYAYSSSDPVAQSIYNSLLAWWDFEENSAGTQFLDASGHGNHLSIRQGGSAVSSSAASTSSGKVGRGFNIPSTSGQLTSYIPRSNTALDGTDADYSFGGWIYIASASFGTSRFLMGRFGTGSNGNSLISLDSSDDSIRGGFSANGSTFQRVTGPTSNGFIMFIVLSFDKTNGLVRLRIKSNQSPTRDFNSTTPFTGSLYTTSSTANFCISQALNNDSSFFSGNRDLHGVTDCCFYRSAVTTEDEFLLMFNGGSGMSFATLSALAGY